jgi:hypothetical protein
MPDDDKPDDDKPDTSGWSQSLQFLWAILKDPERFRRLLVLIFLAITIGLIFKGTFHALVYTVEQHLPAGERSALLALGVGSGVGGSAGWVVVRRICRKWSRGRQREAITVRDSVSPTRNADTGSAARPRSRRTRPRRRRRRRLRVPRRRSARFPLVTMTPMPLRRWRLCRPLPRKLRGRVVRLRSALP